MLSQAAAYVVSGVAAAVLLATAATWAVPDDNHVIPSPGVGDPAMPVNDVSGADPRVIERGRVYYAQICLSCHGVRGDGQGEWAFRVIPRPADLRALRTQSRSDEELFSIISEGLVGTPMIGWKKQLSESQRRQVVSYLRTLAMTKAVVNEQ